MHSSRYLERRGWIGEYFDRTAAASWKTLTSDAPVSRIRASVRAGREETRRTLLDWMPNDMRGMRVLDAGCGTGTLSIDMAQRGARVVAIDLSPTLLRFAAERATEAGVDDRVAFHAGDMLDPRHGTFDRVVAMDSLLHYDLPDIVRAISNLWTRASDGLCFTVAPFTPVLGTLLTIGRLFPRRDRSPRIVPTSDRALRRALATETDTQRARVVETKRIERGFYRSQAYLLRSHAASMTPRHSATPEMGRVVGGKADA